MATRFGLNYEPVLGTSLTALAFGTISFYQPGTLTLQTIYSDDDLGTPKTNPVVLDVAGKHADIFLGPFDYRVIVKDSLGATIPGGDIDPVHGGIGDESATLADAKALYGSTVVIPNGSILTVKDRETAGDGYGGQFYYDASDTSSTFTRDALGFVDDAGRRWKRLYQKPFVDPRWYQLKLDLSTDDTLPLNDLLGDAVSLKVVPAFVKSAGSGINCKKFDLSSKSDFSIYFDEGFPIHGIDTVASGFVFGVGTGYSSAFLSHRITMLGGRPWVYADTSIYEDLVRFWGVDHSMLRFVAQDGAVTQRLVSFDLFIWNEVHFSLGQGSSIPLALPYGVVILNNNVNANHFLAQQCTGRTSATGVGLYMQGAGNVYHMGDLSGWDYGVELSLQNGNRLHAYFESNGTGGIKIRNSVAAIVRGLTVTGYITSSTTAVNLIAPTAANTPDMQDVDLGGLVVTNVTNGFRLYGSKITNIRIPQPGASVTNHVVWQDNSRPRNTPLTTLQVASYTVANLPAASAGLAGLIAYVSNEAGGATIAFCNGTNWKRVTDLATVS